MFSIICVAGFFLFYTWRRIFFILITAGIAFILLYLFPFLQPIAFIIMLLIFLCRLNYILQNWRPVVAGFYMYGIGIGFASFAKDSTSNYSYIITETDIFAYLLFAAVITIIFHYIMTWVYAHGYTLKTAMPIMGVTPLLIILLFLPFIKTFDSFISHVDTTDGNIDVADSVHSGAQGSIINTPDVHHAHEYNRIGPDGNIQHVRGYTATNPDGIIENNFSYHGNTHTDTTIVDKSSVNTNDSTDIIRESSTIGIGTQKNALRQTTKNSQDNLFVTICLSILLFALVVMFFNSVQLLDK